MSHKTDSMVQRFSLYGEIDKWKEAIQEDSNGQWVRWKDVVPYLEFCGESGYTVPGQQLELPLEYVDMASSELVATKNDYDELDDLLDETGVYPDDLPYLDHNNHEPVDD